MRVEQDAAVSEACVKHAIAAKELRAEIATANSEKQHLSADVGLLTNSQAILQQLFRDSESRVDWLTTLLQNAQDETRRLALARADDEEVIRTLTRDGAAAATQCVASGEQLRCLRQQLDQGARDQEALSASLEEAGTELASCQDRERQLDTQLAAAHTSLDLAVSAFNDEKEHSRLLSINSGAAVDSLAHYFADSVPEASVPEAGWIAFAHAVLNPRPTRADGASTLLWQLQVWDVQDEPSVHLLSGDTVRVYAALCAGAWSARLCAQVLVLTAALAQADIANAAVICLLAEEAVRSVGELDLATPAACACRLAVCQLLAVLDARWPSLGVPRADVECNSLALPVVDLVIGRDLANSVDRLDSGSVSLLARQDSTVGFVVDAESRSICAVAKARSRWDSSTTIRIRAPHGPDLIIPIDSDAAFRWIFSNWLG